jgi:hypothetical protein
VPTFEDGEVSRGLRGGSARPLILKIKREGLRNIFLSAMDGNYFLGLNMCLILWNIRLAFRTRNADATSGEISKNERVDREASYRVEESIDLQHMHGGT